MKKILLIAFLVLSQFAIAQDKGTLKGLLTDKESNNEPLPFANILIKGTTIGTTTDFDGNYTLQVPAGSHTVVFSFLGYKTIEKQFTIAAGQTVTINQLMSAEEGVALDDVVVKATTSKDKASALLLEQKKATVIKESIGAEELSKKGVSDAAGAITKISGVSQQQGTSNVYVRGLGDRYQNTTMNGLTMPSNDVNKKNIDLTLFSSDIIENVSISKAYSPEFYADFSAGNVNITSKEYRGDGFFDVSVGTGINTRAVDKSFRKMEGTGHVGFYRRYEHNPFAVILSHGVDPEDAGAPINLNIGLSGGKSFDFGEDSRLSLFATASFQNNYQYREGPAVDYTNVFKLNFPVAREFEYSTATNVMATALYKINSNNNIKYTSLFSNSSTDGVGYFGATGRGEAFDAILNTDEGFYQMNVQFNQDLIFVNQLQGEHKFYKNIDDSDPQFKLTWGLGFNNVYAHEPDRRRISLENYQFALDNDPTTNATFFNNTVFDNQRYFQKIIDSEYNSRLNLEHRVSDNVTLNYGFNGRSKTRNFENIRYGYDFFGNNVEAADPNNLNAVINLNNLGQLYNTEVFNAIGDYPTTNFPGRNENTYYGRLNSNGAYVSGVIQAGDKFTIVPGVRLEYFEQLITYDVININPSDPGFREANETFFLPSLNLKYALTDKQNLRLTFSQTASVPEFKEVAPFVYEAVTQRVGGNPDILDGTSFSEIFNLDLKYEWFISRDELLSLAVFGKQINDPVNRVIASDATGVQRFFRTGEKATVLGFEIEGRKNLIVNSDDETQLAAGFNFTYMHTEQDLFAQVNGANFTTSFNRSTDQIQGASPYLINANIDYTPTKWENFKPTASLVFSYFADRIDALGSGQIGNIVEKGVPTLDFIWKNKIGENMEVNLNFTNILDPKIERIREVGGTIGDVRLSSFQIGSTFSLGFNYKF